MLQQNYINLLKDPGQTDMPNIPPYPYLIPVTITGLNPLALIVIIQLEHLIHTYRTMTPAVMSTVQPLIIVKIGNLNHCKFQTDLCIFEVDQKKQSF